MKFANRLIDLSEREIDDNLVAASENALRFADIPEGFPTNYVLQIDHCTCDCGRVTHTERLWVNRQSAKGMKHLKPTTPGEELYNLPVMIAEVKLTTRACLTCIGTVSRRVLEPRRAIDATVSRLATIVGVAQPSVKPVKPVKSLAEMVGL